MNKQVPIQLSVGATADQFTCGSCKFFERRGEQINLENVGYCNFVIPSWIEVKSWDGESKPPKLMRDFDGCSFYVMDGKSYVVSTIKGPYSS